MGKEPSGRRERCRFDTSGSVVCTTQLGRRLEDRPAFFSYQRLMRENPEAERGRRKRAPAWTGTGHEKPGMGPLAERVWSGRKRAQRLPRKKVTLRSPPVENKPYSQNGRTETWEFGMGRPAARTRA